MVSDSDCKLYISSQIHIKVTYVILKNSAIHLTETKNGHTGMWAKNYKTKRKT